MRSPPFPPLHPADRSQANWGQFTVDPGYILQSSLQLSVGRARVLGVCVCVCMCVCVLPAVCCDP